MAPFMTPAQIAARWGCSASHVRRLCRRGELRAMRIGQDAWRIAIADVEAFEIHHANEPESAPELTPPVREVRQSISLDGFTLPKGYEPCFPEAWGMAAPTKNASRR